MDRRSAHWTRDGNLSLLNFKVLGVSGGLSGSHSLLRQNHLQYVGATCNEAMMNDGEMG